MNDTERLDWLEKQAGAALISDDNGHWAVTWDGVQNLPSGDEPEDIWTEFVVDAGKWSNSVRDAIDAAVAADEREGEEVSE